MNALQRVLHVEDDRSIQAIARLALENVGGLQVLCCQSGQEALQQAAAFDPQFISLDVMMPGLDGPQTLQQLGNLLDLRNIPVAFMTAKVQPDEIAYYRSLGAADVIIKPFDPMTLATQVRSIWSAFHG